MVYRFHYLPSGLFNRAQVGLSTFSVLFMDGWVICSLTLLRSERPKHSECNRVIDLFQSICISVRDRAHQRVIMKGCIQ